MDVDEAGRHADPGAADAAEDAAEPIPDPDAPEVAPLDETALDELRRQAEEHEDKAEEHKDKAARIRAAIGDVEAPQVELPTLARAVEGFLARQAGEGERIWFPWPGTEDDPGMPEDRHNRIGKGNLLPPENGYRPRKWEQLWRKVGKLRPDCLAVLVGATGRGKSGFALTVAESVARDKHPVLFLSAEMSTDELLARLLALRARGPEGDDWGVAWRSVLTGGAPREDLEQACAALVDDCPRLYPWAPLADDRNAEGLERMVRAVVQAEEGRPPLVVVDYLQRMAAGDDLRGAVRTVSGTLRDLSRPDGAAKGCPGAAVLALSSTPRKNYNLFQDVEALRMAVTGGKRWITTAGGDRKQVDVSPEPMVGMGKESGELETDASLLLDMTTDPADPKRPDRGGEPRKALVAVVKARGGGEGLVDFTFAPMCGRFWEGEPEDAGVNAPAPDSRDLFR